MNGNSLIRISNQNLQRISTEILQNFCRKVSKSSILKLVIQDTTITKKFISGKLANGLVIYHNISNYIQLYPSLTLKNLLFQIVISAVTDFINYEILPSKMLIFSRKTNEILQNILLLLGSIIASVCYFHIKENTIYTIRNM